jgi:hypothetical protein
MTTGVMPYCETANLPARPSGWPSGSAHPLLQGYSILMEVHETVSQPYVSGSQTVMRLGPRLFQI